MGTSNDLNISESGIVTFDGTATFRGRTLTAGAGIIITDGNGVAANPVIASNASSAYAPNAVLQEFDDFLRGNSSAGKLQWTGITRNWAQTSGTSNNPGIIISSAATGGDTSSGIYLSGGGATAAFATGGGILVTSFVVDLGTLSSGGNTYRASIGLADGTTLAAASDSFVDGMYFQYTDSVNSGQWQFKCTNTSVTTTTSTTVAAATGFNTFTVISNAAGTSVSFYINGNLAGTAISTNIPTAVLAPFVLLQSTAGNLPTNSRIDLFWCTNVLSNPRPGPTSASGSTTYTLIRQYTPTAVSYQVLGTDSVIGVTNTGAARTITMPLAPTTGQEWTVKDVSLGAATNNITINGNGWNIISDASAATYVINTNGGSAEIFFTGTEFIII